jgi:UDP-N-acetylglucosamine 2-epimerase (non-hydrolysing)
MHRNLFVVGTRPELIKMAPLLRSFVDSPERVGASELVLTGQHGDLVRGILPVFGLPDLAPLALSRPDEHLDTLFALLVSSIGREVEARGSTRLFVHGDTLSCLAGAMVGFLRKLPVVHVEAGLRTYDLASPWPEEATRQLVDRVATLHLCPTKSNAESLSHERVGGAGVHVVGNTITDALRLCGDRLDSDVAFASGANSTVRALVVAAGRSPDAPLVLVTGHRRENQGDRMDAVFAGIRDVADAYPTHTFLFPVHPSPAVRGHAEKAFVGCQNVILSRPLHYAELVAHLRRAHCVVSDSGGLQEECVFLGVPLVLTRDTTERPEALETGLVHLVGTDREAVAHALRDRVAGTLPVPAPSFVFGDGHVSERIRSIVENVPRTAGTR